jgi:hypothetical protein
MCDFAIGMDRGARMGIAVEPYRDGRSLTIKRVAPMPDPFAEANGPGKDHRTVRIGDRIVEVNNVRGTAERLLAEMEKATKGVLCSIHLSNPKTTHQAYEMSMVYAVERDVPEGAGTKIFI